MLSLSYHLPGKRKLQYLIAACLALLAGANILIDYLFTLFQASTFYISESLLFSCFWLLFLPALPVFVKASGKAGSLSRVALFTGLFGIIHLLLYPALVWLLSGIFYDHTYAYRQTFHYGLSAYLIKAVIIYGFAAIASRVFVHRVPVQQTEEEKPIATRMAPDRFSSLLITDNHNRKQVLAVDEILYFSANPPYVNIHLQSKKHLYPATLKMLENQLDSSCFVRVHKSHIININKVVSVESRQNGDYDITLPDNSIVRVSRSYAKTFKAKLGTRLTA